MGVFGLWHGFAVTGCVPPELLSLRGGLDSLRAVVDTLAVRDSMTMAVLDDVRRDVSEQRDILLSTRATTGTTTQEMMDQMTRLQNQLNEVMGRFQRVTERSAAPAGGPQSQQLYDQAALDLAQGRYDLALEGFRDFVRRFADSELSDNAQYGVGECLFALSMFDSAAAEYAKVESHFPSGDKVPASLYKLALSLEKLDKDAEARRTLEGLIARFPLSGEAQLARERLGKTSRR